MPHQAPGTRARGRDALEVGVGDAARGPRGVGHQAADRPCAKDAQVGGRDARDLEVAARMGDEGGGVGGRGLDRPVARGKVLYGGGTGRCRYERRCTVLGHAQPRYGPAVPVKSAGKAGHGGPEQGLVAGPAIGLARHVAVAGKHHVGRGARREQAVVRRIADPGKLLGTTHVPGAGLVGGLLGQGHLRAVVDGLRPLLHHLADGLPPRDGCRVPLGPQGEAADGHRERREVHGLSVLAVEAPSREDKARGLGRGTRVDYARAIGDRSRGRRRAVAVCLEVERVRDAVVVDVHHARAVLGDRDLREGVAAEALVGLELGGRHAARVASQRLRVGRDEFVVVRRALASGDVGALRVQALRPVVDRIGGRAVGRPERREVQVLIAREVLEPAAVTRDVLNVELGVALDHARPVPAEHEVLARGHRDVLRALAIHQVTGLLPARSAVVVEVGHELLGAPVRVERQAVGGHGVAAEREHVGTRLVLAPCGEVISRDGGRIARVGHEGAVDGRVGLGHRRALSVGQKRRREGLALVVDLDVRGAVARDRLLLERRDHEALDASHVGARELAGGALPGRIVVLVHVALEVVQVVLGAHDVGPGGVELLHIAGDRVGRVRVGPEVGGVDALRRPVAALDRRAEGLLARHHAARGTRPARDLALVPPLEGVAQLRRGDRRGELGVGGEPARQVRDDGLDRAAGDAGRGGGGDHPDRGLSVEVGPHLRLRAHVVVAIGERDLEEAHAALGRRGGDAAVVKGERGEVTPLFSVDPQARAHVRKKPVASQLVSRPVRFGGLVRENRRAVARVVVVVAGDDGAVRHDRDGRIEARPHARLRASRKRQLVCALRARGDGRDLPLRQAVLQAIRVQRKPPAVHARTHVEDLGAIEAPRRAIALPHELPRPRARDHPMARPDARPVGGRALVGAGRDGGPLARHVDVDGRLLAGRRAHHHGGLALTHRRDATHVVNGGHGRVRARPRDVVVVVLRGHVDVRGRVEDGPAGQRDARDVGHDVPHGHLLGNHPVPGNPLATPAQHAKAEVLTLGRREVVGARQGVRVVLAPDGNLLVGVAQPAHALKVPAHSHKRVALPGGQRVVVVTGVGIIQAVHVCALVLGRIPPDALVAPAGGDDRVALVDARRVEVLARVGVVQAMHGGRVAGTHDRRRRRRNAGDGEAEHDQS